MIQHVDLDRFISSFVDYGREDNFSYYALKTLFNYFQDYERSSGETLWLDPISICLEWAEYSNTKDAYLENCNNTLSDSDESLLSDSDESLDYLKFLQQRTTVLTTESGSCVICTINL